MKTADLGDIRLNWTESGDPAGAPVVLLHALGADLGMWDRLMAELPSGYRWIRLDMRGHGGSDVVSGPGSMGALVRDVERFMDHLDLRDAVLVGCSIGGLITQGLAVKRLDLVRGMVLAATATRIGMASHWHDRAALVRDKGMEAIVAMMSERWFSRPRQDCAEARTARQVLLSTSVQGYAAGCEAIAGTDFYATTARLTLPTLVIAGSDDRATPPDLVRDLADLVSGADFALLRGAGHLAALDQPQAFAALLEGFLARTGHGYMIPAMRGMMAVPVVQPHHHHEHGADCCGGHDDGTQGCCTPGSAAAQGDSCCGHDHGDDHDHHGHDGCCSGTKATAAAAGPASVGHGCGCGHRH